MGDSGERVIGKRTMASLAESVGVLLRQKVIDQTNLQGYYDMGLTWTAPPQASVASPPNRLGPDDVELFMTTMKDRSGLRFVAETGTVRYWVIDGIDQPSED